MILILLAACDLCDEPIGIEVPQGVVTAEFTTSDGASVWSAAGDPLDGDDYHALVARRLDADGAVSIVIELAGDGAEPCDGEAVVIDLAYVHDDEGVHAGSATLGGIRSDGTLAVTSSWFGSGSFTSGMEWQGEGDTCTPSVVRDGGTLDVFWSSDPADANAFMGDCVAI